MYFSIVVGILAGLLTYTFSGTNLISSDKAKAMIKSGEINKVIDVRTKTEYKNGHYPGALSIPVTTIDEKTTKGLPKSGLLVYCNTGQRARFASEKLMNLEYTKVYYIAGLYTSLL